MVNIPAGYLVLFPLSSLRDLSALRYAAVASLLALTYTGIVLLVELPYYNKLYKPKSVVKIAVFDWNFLTASAMVFYSFTCQMQLLPIYSELVSPSYRRIKKVVVRAFIVDLMFYVIIASAGYFSTFNYTN